MRIICCRFGNKFTQWHVDNLKHMIDKYSGLKYDSFEVVEDDLYGNWFNKFQMYDRFRDGENLYFDLDVIIFDKLPNLIRKDFTLLDDTWWREPNHTPLNSSVVSWTGDVSHIWNTFKANDKHFIDTYTRGSDEWYYKNIKYKTYGRVCPSIKDYIYNKPSQRETFDTTSQISMCTLGQMHHIMEVGWTGWYSKYFLKSDLTYPQ